MDKKKLIDEIMNELSFLYISPQVPYWFTYYDGNEIIHFSTTSGSFSGAPWETRRINIENTIRKVVNDFKDNNNE